ncbi:MAG: acyl-CoA dehydratase activase-related protein [Patescibacteria group bacterium]|nr:acyl-CoA dehydratase activase-related protein [Patescibacteria group bacterium]
MIIGIPRALIYWKRPYFWENFFESLGFEVLFSPKTNKEIIEKGVKVADPETCFSNKVYWGHLLWLEGKVDYIFVPRLKANQEKLEYCPKFFGIPDLTKILVKTSILTETFDERKEKLEKTLERLGKKLKRDKAEVKRAREIAFLKEKEIAEKEKQEFFKKIQSKKPKIVLVSHPYNLYDDYVNLRMKEKLEKLGTEPIFIDEVPLQNQKSKIKNQKDDGPKFHWEFGKEIMEKISAVLNYKITGAIEISSFQCGCDAVLKEFVEKKFKENKIPFLYLLIDEHTGEAGLQTRLEAFIDTCA